MGILEELFGLSGKVVLITGASKGLGEAYALGLAEAGCDVALFARSDTSDLKQQIEDKFGKRAISIRGDVSIEEDAKRAVGETIEKLGAIDILIANAGITGTPVPVHMEDADQWKRVMAVDIDGTFFFCKQALKEMINKKGGKIITTSSMWGITACSQFPAAAYCTAKGAIINFTRELAKQYAEYGITVNCIAPGYFKTEVTDRAYHNPDVYKACVEDKNNLLHKVGEPHDLVGAIIFLASKASDMMTGQVLIVDQGCVSM